MSQSISSFADQNHFVRSLQCYFKQNDVVLVVAITNKLSADGSAYRRWELLGAVKQVLAGLNGSNVIGPRLGLYRNNEMRTRRINSDV